MNGKSRLPLSVTINGLESPIATQRSPISDRRPGHRQSILETSNSAVPEFQGQSCYNSHFCILSRAFRDPPVHATYNVFLLIEERRLNNFALVHAAIGQTH